MEEEKKDVMEVELEGGERVSLSFKGCEGMKFKKFTRVDGNYVLGIAEGPILALWYGGNFAAAIVISEKKESGGGNYHGGGGCGAGGSGCGGGTNFFKG